MFEMDSFEIDRLIPVDGDNLPSTIDGYNVLIVLGGPASVYEKHQYLNEEERLIKSAMAKSIPALGICLGSQLIAKAAGARVYKGQRKEIGWYPVELTSDGMANVFNGLKKKITVFQWHGDTYDLPKNAVTLAKSELYPVQAFKVGSAVGIQFHLEVSNDIAVNWIREYKSELESVRNYIAPHDIIAGFDTNASALKEYTRVLYQNFRKLIK